MEKFFKGFKSKETGRYLLLALNNTDEGLACINIMVKDNKVPFAFAGVQLVFSTYKAAEKALEKFDQEMASDFLKDADAFINELRSQKLELFGPLFASINLN